VANTDGQLSIGAFARRSRLSPKALRLYESQGVLVPEHVDPINGYRRYGEGQLRDARVIRLLRRIDMPLARVAAVVAAPRADWSGIVAAYWAEIEARHARQKSVAASLLRTLTGGKESYPMYEVRIREVPAQTVLTEQTHVRADALPEWIGSAMNRQEAALRAAGGAAVGPALVLYHGEVNEDSDGPVEACTPVDAAIARTTGLPSRVEPAHREAYTTISKAQVAFPDILSAYDAVEAWIAGSGETIGGSPREVYFADFDAAGRDDPVVDIAFPLVERPS
jgi:DNA-binding transcriptional MerR regulator